MRPRLEEIGERICRWIAGILPRRVAYWCFIRVWAEGTTGPDRDPDEHCPSVPSDEIARRWIRASVRLAALLLLAVPLAGCVSNPTDPNAPPVFDAYRTGLLIDAVSSEGELWLIEAGAQPPQVAGFREGVQDLRSAVERAADGEFDHEDLVGTVDDVVDTVDAVLNASGLDPLKVARYKARARTLRILILAAFPPPNPRSSADVTSSHDGRPEDEGRRAEPGPLLCESRRAGAGPRQRRPGPHVRLLRDDGLDPGARDRPHRVLPRGADMVRLVRPENPRPRG